MTDEIKRIEREINQLSEIRDNLTRHISSMKQQRDRLAGKGALPQGKREAISRVQLKPYVERYLELHATQHETNGITFLSNAARVGSSTIYNLLRNNSDWIMLDTADRLLQAMNMTHVLHDLDVVLLDWPLPKRAKPPDEPFHHYEEN